jgi:hypothetical protein
MAKQQARNVANQNNNRTLEPPGATRPATAATPAATATPLNPAQQAYASFQSELFAVNANSAADLKPGLARDLANVAQGPKPSQATVSKLSDHLSTAFAEAKLTTAGKTRVAQDVAVLLNSANAPAAQKQAMIKDVQSILQSGGSSSDNASAVATDLQSVTGELKPGAK